MTADRAQVAAGPFPLLALIVVGTVAVLVGREIVRAQRQALAECAPGCELGAPLFPEPWGALVQLSMIALLVVVGAWVINPSLPQPAEGEEKR